MYSYCYVCSVYTVFIAFYVLLLCICVLYYCHRVSTQLQLTNIQCVPLATEPGWLADRCSVSQQLGALQTHITDTFLFISHTTNLLLFKFRCSIFIGIRIIKEMPGW